MTSYFRSVLVVIGCLGCAACASTDAVTAREATLPVTAEQQVIIKFRATGLDPSHPQFLERLFDATGVRFVYLRAISGGAHVFAVESRPGEADLDVILRRLREHADVQYAEPDRRRRHQ